MSANPAHSSLRHVAIIMDGNGRWAQRRGWPRLKGHHAGAETVRCVLQCCRRAGIQYLTLYAFSKENWRRPKAEVNGLMRLLREFLSRQEAELHAHRVRLRVMGCREDLSAAVRREIARVEAATAPYDSGHLILALSYGGRAEIAHAARLIAGLAAAHRDHARLDVDVVAPQRCGLAHRKPAQHISSVIAAPASQPASRIRAVIFSTWARVNHVGGRFGAEGGATFRATFAVTTSLSTAASSIAFR